MTNPNTGYPDQQATDPGQQRPEAAPGYYPTGSYSAPGNGAPATNTPTSYEGPWSSGASNWPPYDAAVVSSAPQSSGSSGGRVVLVAVLIVLALAAGLGGGLLGAHFASGNTTPQVVTQTQGGNQTITLSPSVNDLQQSVEAVVQVAQPSVVEITSTSGRAEAIGSGDILTADGYIVTNDHVVQGFDTFSVTLSSGKTLSAQVIGQDPQDDLAVIKVSATGLHPITLGKSADAKVGEFVLALGNPLGLNQSATFGIVSALNRTATEDTQNGGTGATLTGLIQTSAPINPGNSGGALVDLQGHLIGIPTLGATDSETGGSADGIGFAIPSDRVSYVTQQLIKNGKLTQTGQGFLGIQGEDVTPQLAAANGLSVQSGILVGGFANDAAGASPAQQAGIQTGDVITAVEGQSVADSGDLASVLLNRSPGAQVSITIQRGSQQKTVQVTLGERPVNTQG